MKKLKELEVNTDARCPTHVIENTIRSFNRKKDEILVQP